MASANFPLSYTAPKTDALNTESMTSPQAERARQRSAEIMATLKKGGPQAAEELMRQSEQGGSKVEDGKVTPELGEMQAMDEKGKAGGLGGWFRSRMGGMKGAQGEGRVVR